MKIRTLIVDDEAAARRGLQRLARAEPDLELAGECADGAAATSAIATLRPDLVFLDIQMPGLSGIEVVREVGIERMPAVVFVTAFDRFAVEAFEINAIDYLVKPVEPARFAAAIERVRQRLAGAMPISTEGLRSALASLGLPDRAWPLRLPVRGAGRVTLVDVERIVSIVAAGNALLVSTGKDGKPHTLRDTLTAVEERLDPARFARISRSAIVNLRRIVELQPLFDGDFVVILDDGSRVAGSRRYRERLGSWL